jgi:hypothetical protein
MKEGKTESDDDAKVATARLSVHGVASCDSPLKCGAQHFVELLVGAHAERGETFHVHRGRGGRERGGQGGRQRGSVFPNSKVLTADPRSPCSQQVLKLFIVDL